MTPRQRGRADGSFVGYRSSMRGFRPTWTAVIVVGVFDGVGCAEDAACQLSFVVDAVPCAVDDCVIDFGVVAPNLSETLRLSWSGACDVNSLDEDPSIVEGGDVFRVASFSTFLGDRGDEGFTFVSATPIDDLPAHGTLDLSPHSLALVVNGD